jgi:hypothetical protein
MALADRPTVYGLDSAEFAAGAYTLGIVHAPGYPLYLLLGKIFSYLPWGDVAYRLNLMSAFFAALTVVVFYRLALKLTRHRLISFSTALFLAFSYYFWTAAIVAEVYALHAFLMSLVLLFLLKWQETQQEKHLYILTLLYGLGLANHTSTSLMAPGLVFFLLSAGRVLKFRVLLGMTLALAAGLSLYVYLPLRYAAQPPFNYVGHYDANGVFHSVNLTTLDGLWWMISGRQFRALMFSHHWPEVWQELQNYAHWLWSNFLVLGIIPGLWGGFRLFKMRGRFAVCLLLVYLANLAFFTTYRIPDPESMFIPTYLIWAIWMAVGCRCMLDEITGWENRSSPGESGVLSGRLVWNVDKRGKIPYTTNVTCSGVLKAILFLAPVATLIINFHYCNLSANWAAKRNASAMLEQVEPDAIIFGWYLTAPTLEYLQVVEGQRPDVKVINRVFIGWSELRQLVRNKIDARPIYTIERDPALKAEYELAPLPGGGYKLEKKTDDS